MAMLRLLCAIQCMFGLVIALRSLKQHGELADVPAHFGGLLVANSSCRTKRRGTTDETMRSLLRLEALPEVENATLRVVNVGISSQAAQQFHAAMCEMGVASMNHFSSCNVGEAAATAYERLHTLSSQLHMCLQGVIAHGDARCKVMQLRTHILEALHGLARSGVVAVASLPQFGMVFPLLQMVPELRVVQTLLSPDMQAKFHYLENAGEGTYMCKEAGARSYFDVIGCLEGSSASASDRLLQFMDVVRQDALSMDLAGTYGSFADKLSYHDSMVSLLAKNVLQICLGDSKVDVKMQVKAAWKASEGGLAEPAEAPKMMPAEISAADVEYIVTHPYQLEAQQ